MYAVWHTDADSVTTSHFIPHFDVTTSHTPSCQCTAGADGLLKLWDSRTGANSATFEGHEDRLWGLAASAAPAESLIATGGGDSRVVIWRDATAAKAAEAEAAEESLVLKQQELSNALAVSLIVTQRMMCYITC
jgi:WD40 repeat protein